MTRNERKALRIQRTAKLKFESAIRALYEARMVIGSAIGEVQMLQFEDSLCKGRKRARKVSV